MGKRGNTIAPPTRRSRWPEVLDLVGQLLDVGLVVLDVAVRWLCEISSVGSLGSATVSKQHTRLQWCLWYHAPASKPSGM